jgi:hypothetical protein
MGFWTWKFKKALYGSSKNVDMVVDQPIVDQPIVETPIEQNKPVKIVTANELKKQIESDMHSLWKAGISVYSAMELDQVINTVNRIKKYEKLLSDQGIGISFCFTHDTITLVSDTSNANLHRYLKEYQKDIKRRNALHEMENRKIKIDEDLSNRKIVCV